MDEGDRLRGFVVFQPLRAKRSRYPAPVLIRTFAKKTLEQNAAWMAFDILDRFTNQPAEELKGPVGFRGQHAVSESFLDRAPHIRAEGIGQ